MSIISESLDVLAGFGFNKKEVMDMKIIGFSSGVVGRESNVDRMVKAIMEKCGYDFEFVKLNDLNYSACKSCVWLCAEPQLCMLEDDLFP